MFNVSTAQSLQLIITYLLAYLISVSIAGCFRAWVAKKLGDPTAEELGFLTLNPLMHIDVFGMICLLIVQFGWGRFVPINPLRFHGRWGTLKLVCAFLSDTVAHLFLATIGFASLLIMFGKDVLLINQPLSQAFPEASSLLLAISFIISTTIILNIMLSVVSCILSACGLGVMFFVEKYPEYQQYAQISMILLPLLILFLFAVPLHMMVIWLISHMGVLLATVFHLI